MNKIIKSSLTQTTPRAGAYRFTALLSLLLPLGLSANPEENPRSMFGLTLGESFERDDSWESKHFMMGSWTNENPPKPDPRFDYCHAFWANGEEYFKDLASAPITAIEGVLEEENPKGGGSETLRLFKELEGEWTEAYGKPNYAGDRRSSSLRIWRFAGERVTAKLLRTPSGGEGFQTILSVSDDKLFERATQFGEPNPAYRDLKLDVDGRILVRVFDVRPDPFVRKLIPDSPDILEAKRAYHAGMGPASLKSSGAIEGSLANEFQAIFDECELNVSVVGFVSEPIDINAGIDLGRVGVWGSLKRSANEFVGVQETEDRLGHIHEALIQERGEFDVISAFLLHELRLYSPKKKRKTTPADFRYAFEWIAWDQDGSLLSHRLLRSRFEVKPDEVKTRYLDEQLGAALIGFLKDEGIQASLNGFEDTASFDPITKEEAIEQINRLSENGVLRKRDVKELLD